MRVQSRGENSVNKGLEVEEHAGGVSSLCQLQDQAPGSGQADREVIASGGGKDEMQPMEGLISHKQTLRRDQEQDISLGSRTASGRGGKGRAERKASHCMVPYRASNTGGWLEADPMGELCKVIGNAHLSHPPEGRGDRNI